MPGVAKRLFSTSENAGVNVVLISQASLEHSITFATIEAQAQNAKIAIEEEFHRELKANHISNVDVKASCAIIAAVGDGMSSTAGISGRLFSALGSAKINISAISQGSFKCNISAIVWTQESTGIDACPPCRPCSLLSVSHNCEDWKYRNEAYRRAATQFAGISMKENPYLSQGPAASEDSSASALLAELLHLMRSKVRPRSGELSWVGSTALLSKFPVSGYDE